MDAELIDLKDYRLSGEGANGSSYDSTADPDVMVKLYNKDYPRDPIMSELEVARKVWEIGVPSPKPGELVTDGERLGIKFRRIVGKRSFSRIFADEPERTEEFAREMARYCKRLHALTPPKGIFPDAKEQFRHMTRELKGVSEEDKAFLMVLIDEVPDSDTALHGDMHFGNIISTLPKGAPLSDPHETYFIDLGYFAVGNPLIDIGMMVNICQYSSEEFVAHDMHISKARAESVLEFFLDEYFFGEEKIAGKLFGPGETIESLKKRLRPYFCIKSILVAYNLGFPLPEFLQVLHEVREERNSAKR